MSLKMIQITNGGITMEVPENELSLYKRAGYSVVEDIPAPVEPAAIPAPVVETEEPAHAEPKRGKKT